MLATNLGLGSFNMLLDSSVAKQQDIPTGLGRVAVPVEHIGFLIRVEDDVSRCHEVDLARVERDKESASSLDEWGSLGADWKTEGRRERLSGLGGSVVVVDGLVQLGTSRAENL